MTSCSAPDYLSKEELNDFLMDESNHLTVKQQLKDVTTSVTFKPTDLLILQENGNSTKIDSVELKRLKNKYANYYYFVLSLSKNNEEAEYQTGGDFSKYSDLVQTLSFRMGQYIDMTTNAGDTIPVGDYIYPRTYGMGNASMLMFAFNKDKAKDKEWIQFNLKEFGLGIGNQNYRFKVNDLESVPKIKFEIKQ